MGDKPIGVLYITAVEGRGLPDKDLIGKMDPYLVFRIDYHTRKTSVKKRAGSNPKWNEIMEVEILQRFKKVLVECLDKDRSSSDLVGKAEILIEDILKEPETAKWVRLKHPHKNKPAGEVYLKLHFKTMREMKGDPRYDPDYDPDDVSTHKRPGPPPLRQNNMPGQYPQRPQHPSAPGPSGYSTVGHPPHYPEQRPSQYHRTPYAAQQSPSTVAQPIYQKDSLSQRQSSVGQTGPYGVAPNNILNLPTNGAAGSPGSYASYGTVGHPGHQASHGGSNASFQSGDIRRPSHSGYATIGYQPSSASSGSLPSATASPYSTSTASGMYPGPPSSGAYPIPPSTVPAGYQATSPYGADIPGRNSPHSYGQYGGFSHTSTHHGGYPLAPPAPGSRDDRTSPVYGGGPGAVGGFVQPSTAGYGNPPYPPRPGPSPYPPATSPSSYGGGAYPPNWSPSEGQAPRPDFIRPPGPSYY